MLHFVSLSRRNGGKLICLALFIITGLLLPGLSASGADQTGQGEKNVIAKVKAQVSGNDLVLTIQGSTLPTYTIYELFTPSRIVVDVADAEIGASQNLTVSPDLGISLTTKSIQDVTPDLIRFEFTLPRSYSFSTSLENNDIIIIIKDFAQPDAVVVQEQNASAPAESFAEDTVPGFAQQRSIESELPQVDPLQQTSGAEVPVSVGETMKDNFNFAGYNKERITVDFYKIDLHNVFRLLREVSGINLVVDESVSGSLTLALNDVPWDFALDIILNLKDLTKEERFNTIIIHPKSKDFAWPTRAEDNLSFEADEDMVVQESLVIQQQESISPAVVDAKKLIAKARKADKRGNAEEAVLLYEAALKKWPENSRLANKIAAIYLVQLRQNAKAAYFANKALAIDGTNSSAALNAAIAHANMQENELALQYFDQSVSVGEPSSGALFSYAAFSEKLSRYDVAIKLLLKHDELYGQNLNSMVARARILDKMGNHASATEVYNAILLAGFRVPADLKKFITARMNLSQSM
jgi:type IV pilus assembly protein PilQ